jgi:hypothetical protein
MVSNLLCVSEMTASLGKRPRPVALSHELEAQYNGEQRINRRKPEETPASQDALKKSHTPSAEGSNRSQL